jgi:hypothetical protein
VTAASSVAELNDPNGTAFTSAAGKRRLQTIALACRSQFG